jgi:hypothetical protein
MSDVPHDDNQPAFRGPETCADDTEDNCGVALEEDASETDLTPRAKARHAGDVAAYLVELVGEFANQ